MQGYELLKAISDREIEDGTKIEIKGDLQEIYQGVILFIIKDVLDFLFMNLMEQNTLIVYKYTI